MKDAMARAIAAEQKRIRKRRRALGNSLTPDFASECMALFYRALQARMAEIAASGSAPTSDKPVDIDALRSRLVARLERLQICDHATCRRAGTCRRQKKSCMVQNPGSFV